MTKDRIDIYLDERKSLVDAQQTSYQQFDKYVLTLSTGFLSLSVVFLKDIFPHIEISHKGVLIISWILFTASILSTLLSFLASQQAYKQAIQITEDYYINGNDKALKLKNHWGIVTMILNLFSATFFVLAVITTIYFVSINFINTK